MFDPQGIPAQTVGYIKVNAMIIHAIPSARKIWMQRNPSVVPICSLSIGTVMAALSIVSGILICQIPELVGGAASFIVFSIIIAAELNYNALRCSDVILCFQSLFCCFELSLAP